MRLHIFPARASWKPEAWGHKNITNTAEEIAHSIIALIQKTDQTEIAHGEFIDLKCKNISSLVNCVCCDMQLGVLVCQFLCSI